MPSPPVRISDPLSTPCTHAEAFSLKIGAQFGLTEAARNVVPVSITSAEAIDQLRDWASGRCLSADHPGVYRKLAAAASRRKITPSAN